jgi:hypothetical protein
MRPAPFLFAIASGLAVVGSACGASHAGPPPAARSAATIEEAPAPEVAFLAPRLDADPATYSACAAPSVLLLHAPDDAADPIVPSCAPGDGWAQVPDREQGATARCDAAGRPGLLARALSGALPLDGATAAHVRAVFQRGQSQGRRGDAFGLVGDSMTLEGSFMRPFATPRPIAPAAARALALATGEGVIDFFRDARASDTSMAADSFLAPRAAKVGVRASWPLTPRGEKAQSPIDEMVAAVSPAYAVVLYGANDAVWRADDAARLRSAFVTSLSAIVDTLEARGIVPLLTTIPKHMRERGWPDCPSGATSGANERFAANATILSAAVADLACQRHLPLIDLRWALDPLLDHGVGPDGVHLSVHPSGGAVLDDAGLQCGYNVRNLVTLRELARVVDAADAATPLTPPVAPAAPRVW